MLIAYELSFQRLAWGPSIHGKLLPGHDDMSISITREVISLQSHDGPFKERLQSEGKGESDCRLRNLRLYLASLYLDLAGSLP